MTILIALLTLAGCHSAKKAGAKMDHTPITDTYWRLFELNGQPVGDSRKEGNEAHMILHSADGRVTGNGGCNNFSGSYDLGSENQISFTQLISTRMACPDMEVEDQLFTVLEAADNYTIGSDTLSLNRAKMAPLARFVWVNNK